MNQTTVAAKITARDIKKLIAAKHGKDMLFFEVKNGATQSVPHHARIDALAIRMSWTRPKILGYEIKVSRQDFLRDDKWQSYLPMCNELYFAVAPDVCESQEVPEQCGLMQISVNGKMLRMLKKAPYRDIEPPAQMYKYLLMKEVGAYWERDRKPLRCERLLPSAEAEKFKDYLDGKKQLRGIGLRASKKLAKDIETLHRENERLKREIDTEEELHETLLEICKVLNIGGGHFLPKKNVLIERIKMLRTPHVIQPQTIDDIRYLHKISERLFAAVDQQTATKRDEDKDDKK